MHQITPIEIRQKSFEKSFRGYNPDEVDAFLHSLAYVWEKLLIQLDETEVALQDIQKEVKRLHGIENAILRTAKDTEIAAQSIAEQAQKEATLKLREAEMEGERRIHEAQKNMQKIEEEHARKQQVVEAQMNKKLEVIQKMIQEAETYRDTLLQKIQHLAEDMLARTQIIQGSTSSNLVPNEVPLKELSSATPGAPSSQSAVMPYDKNTI